MVTLEPPKSAVEDIQHFTSAIREGFLQPMTIINKSVFDAWNSLARLLRAKKNQGRIRCQFNDFDKPIAFHSSLYRLVAAPNDYVKSSVVEELQYEAVFMVFAKFEAIRKSLVQVDENRRVIEDVLSVDSDSSKKLRAGPRIEEGRVSSDAVGDRRMICKQLDLATFQLGNILGVTESFHAEIWVYRNKTKQFVESITGNCITKESFNKVLSEQSLSKDALLNMLREERLRLALNCAKPLFELEKAVDIQLRKTLKLAHMISEKASAVGSVPDVERPATATENSQPSDVGMVRQPSETPASVQQSEVDLLQDVVERLRYHSAMQKGASESAGLENDASL